MKLAFNWYDSDFEVWQKLRHLQRFDVMEIARRGYGIGWAGIQDDVSNIDDCLEEYFNVG